MVVWQDIYTITTSVVPKATIEGSHLGKSLDRAVLLCFEGWDGMTCINYKAAFQDLQYINNILRLSYMIQFNTQTGSNRHKLENKSTGISTKNYVDLQQIEKKWVKTKAARLQKREHFQRYIYKTLLSVSHTIHNYPSLLSIQSINVHVGIDQKDCEIVTFTLQRPFVDSSLKDLFESDSRYDRSCLGSSLFQLLRIFVQESGDPFPVICPSTLLAKKQWNKSFQLFLNHTSLVGYHFLQENEPIFLSKFKQIYCYLHPKVLELRTQKIKIDFTCHLFSFSMNLFSLILGKEISHPLYANRSTITVKADQAEPALTKNLLQMKKLIKSNVVRAELQKAARNLGYQKNHFIKFFETVFGEDYCQPFLSWVEVVEYFNKDFWESLEGKTSAKVFQAMKEIYESQSQDQKNAYARLGVIRDQALSLHSKKELILYSLVRYNELKEVQFKASRQPYFQPGLYKLYKRIELQALEYRLSRAQPQEQKFNQEIEWDIESEIKEGLHFNVHSFQVEREEGIQGQKCATIYAANDFQQTLNIYGSSLWF